MTHEVTNQPPPLVDYNAYDSDPWLRAAVKRAAAAFVEEDASALGRLAGSIEGQALAHDANRHVPVLRTHDRYGRRIDEVEFHPAYHALMSAAFGSGLHSLAWTRPQHGFAARAALFYLWNQVEQGTACPVTMTFASIPVLAHAPALERAWRPKILADAYDPFPAPLTKKAGVTIGMAMTEKQGGSDLRAVQTQAARDGEGYRLTGHKWFCSAPMSDAFFTLARVDEGVTCFLVPRSLPDGERNVFRIQRLKDKCGNRSNASAEVEYDATWAQRVGEPGRGIATLIEMAHHTRFDIVVGVAGMMRAALDHALHHAMHREAFGKRLADHALMSQVLADLALEAEAALLLAFRLAQAFDASKNDPRERALQRVLTPVAKYWLCRRMTPVAVEAMECLGGNGYVEEAPLARLYREAPLNGIWEGSANVICLDALRAFRQTPEGLAALADEIGSAEDPRLDPPLRTARRMLEDPATAEAGARRVVELLATGMQAALMRRHADARAAEAFVVSRVERASGHGLGTLPAGTPCAALAERAAR